MGPSNETAVAVTPNVASTTTALHVRLVPLLPAFLLYIAGIAVGMQIVASAPYTAEAAHYVVARELWNPVPYFGSVYHDSHGASAWLFWQRPVFSLLLWPGAAISFEAYRLLHVALTSFLAPLAYFVLRQSGVRTGFALPAALALALHPRFAPWSTLVLPDALMTVLVFAAVLAHLKNRPLLGAGLGLAATWTKEVAALALVILFVQSFLHERHTEGARLWPLRLGAGSTPYAFAILLAPLPLLGSLAIGGRFPGWGVGGDHLATLERLWLVPWLAPLVFLAPLLPRARLVGGLAALWSLFFLAYHFLLGRAIEIWYHVAPAALAVVASAIVLDELVRQTNTTRRRAMASLALFVAILVFIPVVAPHPTDLNRGIATPFSHRGEWDLQQTLQFENHRDQAFARVVQHLPAHVSLLLAVDVDWSYLYYPLMQRADQLLQQYSEPARIFQQGLGPWAAAIEERANYTLVFANEDPLNQAVREVYDDCRVATEGPYALYAGAGCAGRLTQLQEAYNRRMVSR